jgi:hypothetical protein
MTINETPIAPVLVLAGGKDRIIPLSHSQKLLVCYINSLLQGNAATVTSIGRGIESNTTDKHSLKRATHALFLSRLKAKLGDRVKPIIVTDTSLKPRGLEKYLL